MPPAKKRRKSKTTRTRKASPKRICELIIIWGRNGTGKSTLAKKIIDNHPGKKLLITKSGAPRIWHDVPVIDATKKEHYKFEKETRQIIARFRDGHPDKNKNDTFIQVYNNYRNGFLLLDDCKQYFSSNTENVPGLTDLLIEYRHKMIDIFVVVHGPNQLPPKIWDHASGVIVMATAKLLDKNVAKIDAGEQIIAAQKRVNDKFRKAIGKGDDSQYGIHEFVRL